ncbi:MAG: sugar ABC transporter ATP-binding protein [Thermomicrobiales bacterium]
MPLLSATGITKRFGGVVALRDAAFTCEAGEIHALLGENGAGKSTMVKVLCGVQPPDDGGLTFRGDPVAYRSPAQAKAAGIVPVFQELSLVPDLTVAQNVSLGKEPRNALGLISARAMRRRASELLGGLGFTGIDPEATVADLPLAERQLVEIAKAIGSDPAVLILDEATSALPQREVERVFTVLRRLRAEGKSIIFISHRMDEVETICDRATVFRDGTDVGTVEIATVPPRQIVLMMIGRELREVFPARPPLPEPAEPLLQVEGLTWGTTLRDISLTVRRGEILGLSGLEGQGQGDLLRALFGVYAGVSGTVRLGGKAVRLGSPRAAMAAGIALVPEDRKTQALILPLSIRQNMTLPTLSSISAGGFVSDAAERGATARMRDRLAIKMSSGETPVRFLSGGNQQKVAIAKWLLSEARLYLMHDPTRGIDVGAKQELYALMRQLAAQGHGIILFSTDLAEVTGLCDRALVMYEGAIGRELSGADLTDANLISAAVGIGTEHDPADGDPADGDPATVTRGPADRDGAPGPGS